MPFGGRLSVPDLIVVFAFCVLLVLFCVAVVIDLRSRFRRKR